MEANVLELHRLHSTIRRQGYSAFAADIATILLEWATIWHEADLALETLEDAGDQTWIEDDLAD